MIRQAEGEVRQREPEAVEVLVEIVEEVGLAGAGQCQLLGHSSALLFQPRSPVSSGAVLSSSSANGGAPH